MPYITTLLLLATSIAGAEEWDRFRGPNGSGVSISTGFPTQFGKGKNLVWRTAVRDGKSSPVLARRHIFLTASDGSTLYTQCFDRETGKLLWERSVNRTRTESVNALNHPAAITPVTDGDNVYAFFYEYGLISYSAAGELRWEVKLGPFTNTMGHSSSPILAGGNVILVLDQMVGSNISAFDQRNGELRWRTPREELEGWATPLLYQPSGAAPVVLTVSRGQLGAHRATDGKRLWSRTKVAPSVVASPILDRDTLYTFGYGYEEMAPFSEKLRQFDKNQDGRLSPDEYGDDPFLVGIGRFVGNRDGIVTQEKWETRMRISMAPSSLLALRLGPTAANLGDGESLTKELWRYEKNFVGVVPSPLLYDGVLYVVKNGGLLTTFDARTGEVTKVGRLTGARGPYSASPVAADGKVFLADEEGKVTVLKASRAWQILAVNDLGEACFATPALAAGQLYLRTSETLYRFGSVAAGANGPAHTGLASQ
jgi:outer membrane protein assembly factor BamB